MPISKCSPKRTFAAVCRQGRLIAGPSFQFGNVESTKVRYCIRACSRVAEEEVYRPMPGGRWGKGFG
jgi:hypothetical protein